MLHEMLVRSTLPAAFPVAMYTGLSCDLSGIEPSYQ